MILSSQCGRHASQMPLTTQKLPLLQLPCMRQVVCSSLVPRPALLQEGIKYYGEPHLLLHAGRRQVLW